MPLWCAGTTLSLCFVLIIARFIIIELFPVCFETLISSFFVEPMDVNTKLKNQKRKNVALMVLTEDH